MIRNHPSVVDNEKINQMRAAIEHRAAWLYLLADEAMRQGLDMNVARTAIFRCGCMQAERSPRAGSLQALCASVFSGDGRLAFEQELDITGEEANITFCYCPLVAAWQKQTDDEERIAALCAVAMGGDRSLLAGAGFHVELLDAIARGGETCRLRVTRAAAPDEGAGTGGQTAREP